MPPVGLHRTLPGHLADHLIEGKSHEECERRINCSDRYHSWLLVTLYDKTDNDTFSMKLELGGKVVPYEWHITRLRNIDARFIEMVRRAFDKQYEKHDSS